MKKYIALLRGINVGGHRKILMADLKQMFIEIGYKNPISYIQSGNVIFETSEHSINDIEKRISNAIKSTFNFDVPVIVRQASDLEKIIKTYPFFDSGEDTKSYHITFLSKQPNIKDVTHLESLEFDGAQFRVIGKEIHLFMSIPYHKSKLTHLVLEKKLNVTTTTRNWRTVNKLIELSQK